MNYCSQCGAPITQNIPAGDNRERDVCTHCDTVFYSNPKNVCGCILEWQGKVLLCKRAIEPRYGFWTLPAGFMENGETTAEGAARESIEEANAYCDELYLFALYNLPRINQVFFMYHGTLRDDAVSAGTESLQVKLFDESEIPWDELSFAVVIESLQRYFEDCQRGTIGMHRADIYSRSGQAISIIRY